jgi:rhomboid family GlyGly-CTERM serine protease
MKILRAPLLLFGLPAALLAFAPARHDLFLLDRGAMAVGEVWRLWSGHWVHFSASHLLWNVAVLLAAGAWLEHIRPGLLWRHTGIAAPLIGLAIMIGEPDLQIYGGLSGLATGVAVLLGLHQVRVPGPSRWIWASLLALIAIKSVYDVTQTGPLLVAYAEPGVRSSATAHAAGAIVALAHFSAGRLFAPSRPGIVTPRADHRS